jgi:CheY-like chemotaxis protein/DNA-directed RNA polymerase specialized sigma24 family protein
MSITALVTPQLPLLRRYARALSGSQASGDAHVIAMLESLLISTDSFDLSLDPRVATYRLFSLIWNANPLNGIDEPSARSGSTAERRVDAIAPLPRQAFLLTAVEGFTQSEAAVILGIPDEEFSELLAEATRQIGEQVAARVLIIEDEPLIAMDLEGLVEGLGHTVVGNARTREEAVVMARLEKPGLILADVRLADGSSGIDAVNDILGDFSVPAVFITAYPESLLTGARPEPTFLIAKPFRDDTVKAIVSQALFFKTAAAF